MAETQPAALEGVGLERLAVRAAVWGTACLHGDASPDLAGDRITGGGPQQRVLWGDGVEPESWPVALARWSSRGVRGLRLALPVPGDVAGVPGPAPVARAAVQAGAAVIAVGGRPVVLVPEPGRAQIDWRAWPSEPPPPPGPGLAEADRALRESLRAAAEALSALQVARWTDDGGDVLTALRTGALDGEALPAPYPPRARQTLALARRLRAVCATALADDGGAVGRADSDARRSALRGLDRAARVAEMAACNALLDPQPG
jgi:hypothetical protein